MTGTIYSTQGYWSAEEHCSTVVLCFSPEVRHATRPWQGVLASQDWMQYKQFCGTLGLGYQSKQYSTEECWSTFVLYSIAVVLYCSRTTCAQGKQTALKALFHLCPLSRCSGCEGRAPGRQVCGRACQAVWWGRRGTPQLCASGGEATRKVGTGAGAGSREAQGEAILMTRLSMQYCDASRLHT